MVSTGGTALRAAVTAAAGTSNAAPTGVTTPTASTVMGRDAAGRSQVEDPSANKDIANKQWVAAQVATSLPTSQKAAASGVASLDSTSVLSASQVPTYLGRSLGSGTTLPSARQGDTYFHTGLNSLLMWNGSQWAQVGEAEVASRTARNTMGTTYGAIMPSGFTVVQDDKKLRWRWTENGWAYAGYTGTDPYGQTVNTPTKIHFYQTNLTVANGAFQKARGWAVALPATHITVPAWISHSNGTFTINDNCNLTAHVMVSSDAANDGRSDVLFNPPGGDFSVGTAALRSCMWRGGGFGGAGWLQQPITWSGAVRAGTTCSVDVNWYPRSGANAIFQFDIAFEIQPL